MYNEYLFCFNWLLNTDKANSKKLCTTIAPFITLYQIACFV